MERNKFGTPDQRDEKSEAKARRIRSILEKAVRERLIVPVKMEMPPSIKARLKNGGYGSTTKR